MYLDPLLPRICQLAESSSDRRTKVAACEVLHAIVIFMVAARATNPNRDRPV
jgi:DNA-dependent protein kinase catalytic subunit